MNRDECRRCASGYEFLERCEHATVGAESYGSCRNRLDGSADECQPLGNGTDDVGHQSGAIGGLLGVGRHSNRGEQ